MITTVTLGRAAQAKRNVIVKHFESIQNLGSIDVLCSDKTGTLTSGETRIKIGVVDDECDLALAIDEAAPGQPFVRHAVTQRQCVEVAHVHARFSEGLVNETRSSTARPRGGLAE